MWKSQFYGAFVLNHRVVSTPSTRRLLDGVHPTHWLISTQVLAGGGDLLQAGDALSVLQAVGFGTSFYPV